MREVLQNELWYEMMVLWFGAWGWGHDEWANKVGLNFECRSVLSFTNIDKPKEDFGIIEFRERNIYKYTTKVLPNLITEDMETVPYPASQRLLFYDHWLK